MLLKATLAPSTGSRPNAAFSRALVVAFQANPSRCFSMAMPQLDKGKGKAKAKEGSADLDMASQGSKQSWLPSQDHRLGAPRPQPRLLRSLRDAASPDALAWADDAAARGSDFDRKALAVVAELRSERLRLTEERDRAARRRKELTNEMKTLQTMKKKKEPSTSEPSNSKDSERDVDSSDDEMQVLIEESRKERGSFDAAERQRQIVEQNYDALLLSMPNLSSAKSPIGAESQARVVEWYADHSDMVAQSSLREAARSVEGKTVSLEEWDEEVTSKLTSAVVSSPPKSHLDIAAQLEQLAEHGPVMDLAAGRLATGPAFPFLLDSFALLEQALLRLSMNLAVQRGFKLVSTPAVVKTDIAKRCGFNPRGGQGGQTYFVQSSTELTTEKEAGSGVEAGTPNADAVPELCLVGTAEIAIAGLLANRTFSAEQLPLRLMAVSPSFRAEAGGRGASTKGLYRLHQFSKAEMFIVSPPGPQDTEGESRQAEASDKYLDEELVVIQKDMLQRLGLAYRVLEMPTEELGASAHRKQDIEAWMPGRGSWGEVTSASNCTDYQASRLHIMVQEHDAGQASSKTSGHTTRPAHTLNATLCAVPRMIIALVEQHGIDDQSGKLRLPDALRPHWPGSDSAVVWFESQSASMAMPSSSSPSRSKIRERLASLSRSTGTDLASLTASCLILHEITAIVPLVLFFYLLSFFGLGVGLCEWFMAEANGDHAGSSDAAGSTWGDMRERWRLEVGRWIREGMTRAEKYARSKGWWGFEKGSQGETDTQDDTDSNAQQKLVGAFANAVGAYVLTKVSERDRMKITNTTLHS
ncbi:unnamed protein product [Jaminaea pallidilutea]